MARTPTPPGSRTITPGGSRTTTNDLESRVPTTRDRPPLASGLDADTIREPVRTPDAARPRTPTATTVGRTRTRATPFQTGDSGPHAAAAADRARKHLDANEHELALREATAALHLAPESFDYQALHAWATFCAAKDKAAAADVARKQLEKASHRADAPHEVRLLLGRLERAIGREREALRHFRAVLERVPDHAAATAELRELEAKLEAFARR
jgi:tetratricopeptide (TPR) repeat protein